MSKPFNSKCAVAIVCSIMGLSGISFAQTNFKFKQHVYTLEVIDPSQKSSNYSLSVPNLVFPATSVGLFSSQTVLVLNEEKFSLGPVDIHLAVNDGVFRNLQSNCSTILVGAQCEISLDFYPKDNVAYNNDIIVTAPNMTTKSLSVMGFGLGQAVASLEPNAGSSTDFGITVVGQKKQAVFTFKNTGNATDKNIYASVLGEGLSIKSTNCGSSEFTTNLLAGGSCTITLEYAPTSKNVLNGSLAVSSNALQGVKSLAITGTGGLETLEYSSDSIDFGTVEIGNYANRSLSILNSGNISTNGTDITLTGNNAYKNLVTSCGAQINPSSTCFASVDFYPTTVGAVTGAITVKTAAGENKTIALSGIGSGHAVANLQATSINDFGFVEVGDTKTLSFTFKNDGNIADLGVYPQLVNSQYLSISNNTCGSQGTPGTIAANQTCSFDVIYSPAEVNTIAANIAVTSSATEGTKSLALIGSAEKAAISYSSDSLSFSSVEIGSDDTKTISLTNSGKFPVKLSSAPKLVNGASSALSLTTTCGTTLAVSEVCNIVVKFTPAAVGLASGQVEVKGINVPDKLLTISATGSGHAIADLKVDAGSSTAFGIVEVGSSKIANFTFKNTGNAPDTGVFVNLAGNYLQVENNSCGTSSTPVTINAGASCSFAVRYAPAGVNAFNGTLSIQTTASTGINTLVLSGTPGQAVIDSSTNSVNFGSIQIGSNDTKSVVISNTGNVALNLNDPVLRAGSSTYFQALTTSCGASLAPNANCSMSVSFVPGAVGTYSGYIDIASSNAATKSIGLSGTGAGQANVSINLKAGYTSDFGYVKVGSSAYAEYLFRNNGNIAATGVYPTITGANLTISPNTCGTAGSPGTLAPGASCSIGVTYAPTSATQLTGAVLTVNSSATVGTNTITFSGFGSNPVAGLSIAPGSSTNFGTVIVGQSATRYFVFQNTGNVRVNNIYAMAGGSTITLSDNNCGTSSAKIGLDPGASCTVGLTYTPTTNSTLYDASITVESESTSGNKSFTMTGQGAMAWGSLQQQSGYSPNFGTVVVNSPTVQKFIFANQGDAVATGVYATVSGTGYSITSNTCGTSGSPTSVAAAYSCNITVQFNSATTGSFNGALTVYSSAPNSPSSLSLSASVVSAPVGEQSWTAPGTYTFTVPANVYSVSAVAIGGGGAQLPLNSNNAWSGGGGALTYINNLSVTPGQSISVVVGARGVYYYAGGGDSQSGGASSFGIMTAGGGGGAKSYGAVGIGGTPSGTYTAGFSGGNGIYSQSYNLLGGSAGGYSANGATGGNAGTGLYGGPGSYGKGDSAAYYNPSPSNSTDGAVRVIWGPGRSFPSNAN